MSIPPSRQESGRAFGDYCRRSERTGCHQGKHCFQGGVPSHRLGSTRYDLRRRREPRPKQVLHARNSFASPWNPPTLSGTPTVRQERVRVSPHRSPDQGNSLESGRSCPPSKARNPSRAQSAVQWHSAPEASRSHSRGREKARRSSRILYAGAITTKRRGSSPSDLVTTCSFSVNESCTALRSAADIGSRARSSPVSTTSPATCWANRPRAATRRSRYWATSTKIRSVRLGLLD